MRLSTADHDRGAAGMRYVYPVVSRRAGGVSVGINLNPNDACNWRCVYCQVPGLVAGKGPAIDLGLLREELARLLGAIVRGDFLERSAPEGLRRLCDVALSGNGEPTSSPDFRAAIEVAHEVLQDQGAGAVPIVVITNGSLARHAPVQAGLRALAERGGQAWFKLDSATDEGQARLNGARAGAGATWENLRACAATVATWVQTMALAFDGEPPSAAERAAYLALLARARREGLGLRGVLLYGLARPSHQPEAPRLAALPAAWLEALAADVRALGLAARVFP